MRRYLLSASLLAGTLFAESLPVIIVDSNQESDSTEISATKINKVKIENSFRGNGYMSSLLDTHPAIDVEDSSKNSATAGEIKPGKISFHNAPYYQNNFQIDGISNDSLLDPTISSYKDPYDVPGNENEIFLDLDLIDSVKIYDSNIPVRYGNFTGGVIDAKTISARTKEAFKISYRHTSDSLTKIHVTNKESFNKANSDSRQPNFDKKFFSMYYTRPIDYNNGILFSYSKNESIIPGAYLGGFKDKKRLNESFFLKWSHYFDDDSILNVSSTYAPYESTHFEEYVKDSFTKVEGGGATIKINYEKNFNTWNFDNNLALKYSQNKKDSLNYRKTWIKSKEKPWGPDAATQGEKEFSEEGGSGNIEKTQTGLNYNAHLTKDEFNIGSFSHKISTGIGLNYDIGEYNRKENTYYYSDIEEDLNIYCGDNTIDCINAKQYFKTRRVYQKEKVDVGMFSSNINVQNKIKYGRFEFTPGLRADYNNYLKNLDFSYRLNGSVKPFNNDKTVIFAGFNRYYGKSFLGYKLREARLPYYDNFRDSYRNEPTLWGTSADKDLQKYQFSDLKTPYTDERSIGVRQDFDLIKLRTNLKYVHRDSKNRFSKHKGDYKVFTMPDGINKGYYKPTFFGNEGYSKSERVTLSLNPTKPLEFSFGNMGYSFSTSWSHTSSNIVDYDDVLDDDKNNTSNIVYYNGRFLDKNKLPTSEKPKKYNVHFNFNFKKFDIFGLPTKLNLNSIVRYNAAYNSIKVNPDKKEPYTENLPNGNPNTYPVDVYEDYKFKDSVTLDLKASFNFKVHGKHHLKLNTEVTNVFDTVKNVGINTNKYELGRQIWLGLAYNF